MNSKERLTQLFNAKTPIIQIVTTDTLNCIDTIKKAMADAAGETFSTDAILKLWTPAFGGRIDHIPYRRGEHLIEEEFNPPRNTRGQIDEEPFGPMEVLAEIFNKAKVGSWEKTDSGMRRKGNKDRIYILKDYHFFTEDIGIVATLHDMYDRHISETPSYCPLIIMSPIQNVPKELADAIPVINFDLPDHDEILRTLTNANRKAKEAISDNEIATLADIASDLTLKELHSTIEVCLRNYGKLDKSIFYSLKIEKIKATGMLEYSTPSLKLEDMGGNEGYKAWISTVKNAFTEEAKRFGVEAPKGCLCVGAPGTCKSLSAKVLASELNMPLLKFSISSVMHSHVGQTEKNMAQVVELIEKAKPCVLLVDEVEKTLSGTGSSNNTDGGTLMRVVGSLLEFLGDPVKSEGVFTVFTSNDAQALPPELTRSGRIDTTWYFGIPEAEEQKQIFRIHFKNRNREVSEKMLNECVKYTKNFTGAEIEQATKNIVKYQYNRYLIDNNAELTVDDIKQGCAEVVPVWKSSKEKIKKVADYYKNRARNASEVVGSKAKGTSESTTTTEESFDFN